MQKSAKASYIYPHVHVYEGDPEDRVGLQSPPSEKKFEGRVKNVCPDCGNQVFFLEAGFLCPTCGYSIETLFS